MTTYSAFINDNGTAVPFPGVPSPGGVASTVQVAVSQSRPTAIASGGAYDVPEHTVGGNKLQVFIDGLLITPTIDYQEISQTQIVFNDSVPADRQIVIYRR